jgi:protein-disulfide isomerase
MLLWRGIFNLFSMTSLASFWRQKKKPIVVTLCVVLGFLGLWGLGKLAAGTAPEGVMSVREDDWTLGSPRARATLVEYADFQCPACASVSVVLKQMLEKYPDDLRLVYRHFPLTQIHPNATVAAKAAEAAGKQGKFWEMSSILFEKQGEWSNQPNPVSLFAQYAVSLGLNSEQFSSDLLSSEVAERVERGAAEARAFALTGTPSLFLNGEKIQIQSIAQLESLIQSAINNSDVEEVANTEPTAVHWHFDLKTVINGKEIDFSQSKYQSTETDVKAEFVHLHDGNGKVVHIHQSGVSLQDFFQSIGMDITTGCFTTDTKETLCSTNTKTLSVYVNGEKEPRAGEYEPKDLDRILIVYGPKNDASISQLIEDVSNDACIYSETCPERGAPPKESCVGGVGSECEVGHSHND